MLVSHTYRIVYAALDAYEGLRTQTTPPKFSDN